MALDIFIVKNHENKNFFDSVDIDNSTKWDSLWERIDKESDLSIDPYGTTRLYSNHVSKLLKILNEDFKDEPVLKKFKTTLESIKLEREDIIILEGD